MQSFLRFELILTSYLSPTISLILSILTLILSFGGLKHLRIKKWISSNLIYIIIRLIGVALFTFLLIGALVELNYVLVPDVVNLTYENAKGKLVQSDLKYTLQGEDQLYVVEQNPSAGYVTSKGSTITLVLGNLYDKDPTLPDSSSVNDAFMAAFVAYENDDIEYCTNQLESDTLQEIPQAKVNIGYLYETGLAGSDLDDEKRIRKALSYYQQSDITEALRGQLSCLIKLQADAASIQSVIGDLLALNDQVTLQYLSLTLYEQDYSTLTAEQIDSFSSLNVENLYVYSPTGEIYTGSAAPKDTTWREWRFDTIDQVTNQGQGIDHTVMRWSCWELSNIELLTHYIATLN